VSELVYIIDCYDIVSLFHGIDAVFGVRWFKKFSRFFRSGGHSGWNHNRELTKDKTEVKLPLF
jgi:hypothetical protein